MRILECSNGLGIGGNVMKNNCFRVILLACMMAVSLSACSSQTVSIDETELQESETVISNELDETTEITKDNVLVFTEATSLETTGTVATWKEMEIEEKDVHNSRLRNQERSIA